MSSVQLLVLVRCSEAPSADDLKALRAGSDQFSAFVVFEQQQMDAFLLGKRLDGF
jgi:hypothetical protein